MKNTYSFPPRIGISYASGFPMNYRIGNHIINPSASIDVLTGMDTLTGRPLKQSKLVKTIR